MLYSEQNDDMLVTLTLAGDPAAYEALVRRYQRQVLAAAYAITQNSFMAEDAAQDAFVTGWMKLDRLREADKFCPWVCRIAKNCAKNMLVRVQHFLSLDQLQYAEWETGCCSEDSLLFSEEHADLHESVKRLPDKVRQVIHLHYFEGLSITEIADKLRIPVGTVKWQLHDGRQKIRKELCAMNEIIDDTLVTKVMKKVEELKLWLLKNDRSGFEKDYATVLAQVESLPESADKQHALADVLLHGWWWLPGEKNQALLARIKQAALDGHNEDVMRAVMAYESEKLSGENFIRFVQDTQIPWLEQHGFTKTQGYGWFWLGHHHARMGNTERALAAYAKVLELLEPRDAYYACALAAQAMEHYRAGKPTSTYTMGATAEHLRWVNGELRYWCQPGFSIGKLDYIYGGSALLYCATLCDRYLYHRDAAVGDVFTGSDGSTLTFKATGQTVDTPAGRFADCVVWESDNVDTASSSAFGATATWYKEGVGIVRQESLWMGNRIVLVLQNYTVSGTGLFPCATGNRWVYGPENPGNGLQARQELNTLYADEQCVNISCFSCEERSSYDVNDWEDMMQQMRMEYVQDNGEDGDGHLQDVSHALQRAAALADTPYRQAHTRVANTVMQRIFDTDGTFSPNRTHKGYWNFFHVLRIYQQNDMVHIRNNRRYGFEWKESLKDTSAWRHMLHNDLLGILEDAVHCLWDKKWLFDFSEEKHFRFRGDPVDTSIRIFAAGTVTTVAGTFPDCITVALDIEGIQHPGIKYRGGHKEYTFAPGIGMVRMFAPPEGDELPVTYELTAYTGTGEGYVPMQDGLFRRYEATELKDGNLAYVEYTYVNNDEGQLCILVDQCGIRELPQPIS